MTHLTKIAQFILDSFIHIWPYLVVTIPLAVVIKYSKASRYINGAMRKTPLTAIFLATVVGAFSPFCSCGVIPVITSLLIGGVPLAPVMSFWIASPSMDPEIFFLSVGTIGLSLSIWRLAATFMISLCAGLVIHLLMKRGFITGPFVKSGQFPAMGIKANIQTAPQNQCCDKTPMKEEHCSDKGCSSVSESPCGSNEAKRDFPKSIVLLKDTGEATWLVIKFMGLAFLINALIQFYLPAGFIDSLLGGDGGMSVIIATLVGIPAYTTNLTALPMIEGLLALGMNKGAALAFLVAGPVTTLPAMSAVWGITNRKVFAFYLLFSVTGAFLTGVIFNIFN